MWMPRIISQQARKLAGAKEEGKGSEEQGASALLAAARAEIAELKEKLKEAEIAAPRSQIPVQER